MAKHDTMWTTIGITEHQTEDGQFTRRKVRYGTDLVTRHKSANSSSYIQTKGKPLKCMRRDFVEIKDADGNPTAMLKLDALKYALAHPHFQSEADQQLIYDQIDQRLPKVPRKRGRPRKDTTAVGITSIGNRKRNDVSVADIISIMKETNENR